MNEGFEITNIFIGIALVISAFVIPMYLFETSEAGMYKDCLDSCRNTIGFGADGSNIYEVRFDCIKECNNNFKGVENE